MTFIRLICEIFHFIQAGKAAKLFHGVTKNIFFDRELINNLESGYILSKQKSSVSFI